MEIRKWNKCDAIPYELLLLADPDRSAIDCYFLQSDVFLLLERECIYGVICIQNGEDSSEIVNISVSPSYQGQGYGKKLIQQALTHALWLHKSPLIVKTANSSIQALAFYQKNGFRMVAIIPDYFTKNYAYPIFENGIRAQDQIVLAYFLKN
ncbi:GNAT family N-acetyltransferase [Listeria rocourtiae]|uniref:GNAT family N-acetyltransferase n=1 Tax=Listeria rocourtiae TaxID=647910 RepID=UPI00162712E5|nr:GNAT family N-acetyltransferase [Listeria rocourtiae]MBC1435828.1 GNAT family N-acetyltransferase [Listeria rocourtiae]